MKEIKTILVPVDLEGASKLALEHALPFAAKLGAEVVVLHVYSTAIPPYPIALMPEPSQLEQAAREALSNLIEKTSAGRGVSVEGHVRGGDAPAEILAQAKESNVDLIFMMTHGRRGLSRALLGSVAEKVVRLSPVPVLTVRATEDAG